MSLREEISERNWFDWLRVCYPGPPTGYGAFIVLASIMTYVAYHVATDPGRLDVPSPFYSTATLPTMGEFAEWIENEADAYHVGYPLPEAAETAWRCIKLNSEKLQTQWPRLNREEIDEMIATLVGAMAAFVTYSDGKVPRVVLEDVQVGAWKLRRMGKDAIVEQLSKPGFCGLS